MKIDTVLIIYELKLVKILFQFNFTKPQKKVTLELKTFFLMKNFLDQFSNFFQEYILF